MTHLVVRDFEVDDLLSMERNGPAAEAVEEDPQTSAITHKYAGPSYTICTKEGEVVGCIGIHRLWAGTGEAWAVFSPLVKKYPMAYFETKRLLYYHQKHNAFHRLQATARCDWPESLRFLEHLGFKAEGKLEAYGPWGADSMMYAIVDRG